MVGTNQNSLEKPPKVPGGYPDVPIEPRHQIRVFKLLPGGPDEPITGSLRAQSLDTTVEYPQPQGEQIHPGLQAALDPWTSALKTIASPSYVKGMFNFLVRKRPFERARGDSIPPAEPRFTALSYTWGEFGHDYPQIHVHGRSQFPVTHNLYQALRRLRHPSEAQYFWIDQVSIDQHTEKDYERNCQVQHVIDKVYLLADRILIWFGDGTKDPPRGLRKDSSAYKKAAIEQLRALVESEDAERVWWARSWVVQEYLMAQREPAVMFGAYTLTWTELQMAVYTYGSTAVAKTLGSHLKNTLRDRFSGSSNASASEEEFRRGMGVFQNTYYSPMWRMIVFYYARSFPTTRGLASLGWVLMHGGSKLPHDRVYSLLGLLPAQERASIEVDYSKEPRTVFKEATYTSIRALGSFQILHLVKQEKTDDTLPSWVVDFAFSDLEAGTPLILPEVERPETGWTRGLTTEEDMSRLSTRIALGSYIPSLFQEAPESWCQKQNRKLPLVALQGHEILAFTGLEFDVVQGAISMDSRHLINERFEEYVGQMFLGFPGRIMGSTYVKPTIEEKMLLDNIPTRPFEGLRTRKSDSTSTKALEKLVDDLNERETLNIQSLRLFHAWSRKFLHPFLPNYENLHYRKAGIWMLYLSHLSKGHTLYITSHGFLGWGHKDTRRGDVVTLPYGSQLPMLLRWSGDTYQFRGFTYVNGIMHGELSRLPSLVLLEKAFALA
jgi:hypothetical protein